MKSTEILRKSPSLRSKLKSIVEDEDVLILIRSALENMGQYRKDSGFKDIPHHQSMVSGGREAVDMFITRFRSLPYMGQAEEESEIEFDDSGSIHNLI